MKKLFYLLIFLVVPSVGFSQNSSPFDLVDGYFQASPGALPVHLTHPLPYPPQWVSLGEPFRAWYSIALRAGEKNPCERQAKVLCKSNIYFNSLTESLANPNVSYSYKPIVTEDIWITNDLQYSFSIPTDRVKTPLGPARLVWTIEKEGKVVFYQEVNFEVR